MRNSNKFLMVLRIIFLGLGVLVYPFMLSLFDKIDTHTKVGTLDNGPKVLNAVISPTGVNNISALESAQKINDVIPEEKDDIDTSLEAAIEANINLLDQEQVHYYNVVRVVDGDTIVLSDIGTIRFIGIDTPETVDPRTMIQCFGKEASNYMSSLVTGQEVYLEFDDSQGRVDKYGRTLAYVFIKGGLFVNLEMIKKGFAFEYTYNLPYKYQTEFKNAQSQAQNDGLGLWSTLTCSGLKIALSPTP